MNRRRADVNGIVIAKSTREEKNCRPEKSEKPRDEWCFMKARRLLLSQLDHNYMSVGMKMYKPVKEKYPL